MKIIVFLCLIVNTLFSQPYLSIGLSMTNSDNFKESSYASIEAGYALKGVSFGASIGKEDLSNLSTKDNTNQYLYEIKTNTYFR